MCSQQIPSRILFHIYRMLLNEIDVSRFGSRVTLYNANDASVIINSTTSLSDFYQSWSRQVHEQQPSGLSLPGIVKKLHEIGKNMLNDEHTTGRSFIALIMPHMTNLNEADHNWVLEQMPILRETQPDLKLIFWSGGALSRFQPFVLDETNDLFQLQGSSSENAQQTQTYVFPVVRRIRWSKFHTSSNA